MSSKPRKLLFVCMGNICRSPTAEGIMRQMLADAGLADQVECDSAGTTSFHSGNPPDRRMSAAASKRGYRLAGRARGLRAEDLQGFDLILTMDDENYTNTRALDPDNKIRDKVRAMCDFCSKHEETEVPDPYYGGNKGFEVVMDILEDACQGLQKHICKEWGLESKF